MAGVLAELGVAAVADLVAAALPVGESLVAGAREALVQFGEERECLGGEDLVGSLEGAPVDCELGLVGRGGEGACPLSGCGWSVQFGVLSVVCAPVPVVSRCRCVCGEAAGCCC